MIIIFIYHNFIVLYKLQYWKHSCMFYVCDTCRYVTVGSCLYSWSGLHWLYWFNDTRPMFLFLKKIHSWFLGFGGVKMGHGGLLLMRSSCMAYIFQARWPSIVNHATMAKLLHWPNVLRNIRQTWFYCLLLVFNLLSRIFN